MICAELLLPFLRKRESIFLILSFVAASAAAGAQGSTGSAAAYPLNRGGIVEVRGGAGPIAITGSRDARVHVPDAESWRVDVSPASVLISRRGAPASTAATISVPEGARVVVRTVSGSIAVRSVRGIVEVDSQAGRIDIDSVTGAVKASSIAGDIFVRDVGASVDVEVVAGRVDVRGTRGDLRIRGVDGRVNISDVLSQNLAVETISGAITCSSALPAGGSWSLESFSGSVRVAIPRNASALFSVETFAGEVRTDIPMTLESPATGRGGAPGQRRTMRLGEGSTRITLRSFSGALIVQPLGNRDQPGN
jgi:DUF4097 and DUF4098 domain-containing protein YvlB